MKSEDFARAMNERKLRRDQVVKRRMPVAVVITMIFALLALACGGVGIVNVSLALGSVLRREVPTLAWGFTFVRDLVIVGVAAATLFACLKRPRWGYGVSMAFAIAASALIVYLEVTPDPHPVFQIAPGAEQVGAYASHALIIFGILAYALAMVRGAKVRAYFVANELL